MDGDSQHPARKGYSLFLANSFKNNGSRMTSRAAAQTATKEKQHKAKEPRTAKDESTKQKTGSPRVWHPAFLFALYRLNANALPAVFSFSMDLPG